jgi:outer membrane protein assembly factor BamB
MNNERTVVRYALVKRIKTGNEVLALGSAVERGNIVYFAGLKNGELKKYNAEWNEVDVFKTQGQIRSIASMGDHIILTSWDKNIYCIGTDMHIIWKSAIDAFPFGVSVGRDFGAYTTNSGMLRMFDKDGNTRWERRFEGSIETVFVMGDKIYTGTYKGEALMLDREGNVKWQFNCGDMVKTICGVEQFIIIATAGGKIFMFRPDGTMYWVQQVTSPPISSACTGELIAVGLFNNSVLFFDKTGKVVQKLEETTKLSTLTFLQQDTLITGTQSINVYQNYPDENVEILYEIMCIGGKCGTFISAELVDNCPQCGSDKIISRVVLENRFRKEFD